MLELQKIFLLVRFFNRISCNKDLKAKISRFTCFFCLTPLRLECFRSRKTTSFLTSHRLTKYNFGIHGASQMERKRGECWKLSIFEGTLQVFIRYLSEMKRISMFYTSYLFYHFLQLVSTTSCPGDFQIQAWQGFRHTFCFHFKIWMILTAVLSSCTLGYVAS